MRSIRADVTRVRRAVADRLRRDESHAADPVTRVVVLEPGPSIPVAARVADLAKHGQPERIVDLRHGHGKRRRTDFVALFPLLAPGGSYRLVDVSPVAELLRDIAALHEGAAVRDASPVVRELAVAAASVVLDGGGATVTKRVAHQFKLRDRAANRVLDARFGRQWGEVVLTRPAEAYPSKTTLVVHPSDGPDLRAQRIIEVPERYLRRYEGVQCWPRQRVRYGEYWLPDTFRHPQHKPLGHRGLASPSRFAGRLRSGAPGPTRSVDGPYFFFDTEFPGHFGHVLTEVVSRHWGWLQTRARVPEVRPIVSLDAGMDTIPGFQQQILTVLGVDVDTIEYVRWGECVAVETLYAASPDFAMPGYAAPQLATVWDTIRRGCEIEPAGATSKRIFISRRARGIRTCLNSDEVEALFTRLGFQIVFPEDHDFSHQVTMFSRAEVIAGFGGSGMFSAMFSPGATMIIIAADSYTATNEYLISSVNGGAIHYFWGRSVAPEQGEWKSFQSNFTFDVDRYATEIADALAERR